MTIGIKIRLWALLSALTLLLVAGFPAMASSSERVPAIDQVEGENVREHPAQSDRGVVISSILTLGTLACCFATILGWGFFPVRGGTRQLKEENPFERGEDALIKLPERDKTAEEKTARLEADNEELQHLLRVISHDLKSPLATITGFLALAMKSEKIQNEDDLRGYLQRSLNNANRMRVICDNMLQLAKAEHNATPPAKVDMLDLVNETIALMEYDIGRIQASIEVDEYLPDVNGSAEGLTHVLANLISNALKYHSPERPPKIEIGLYDTNPTHHTFYIRDNGLGIPPDRQEHIFNAFHQLDGKKDGAGVGLAIVKKLVDKHGGTIRAESNGRDGTTFYLTLPRSI